MPCSSSRSPGTTAFCTPATSRASASISTWTRLASIHTRPRTFRTTGWRTARCTTGELARSRRAVKHPRTASSNCHNEPEVMTAVTNTADATEELVGGRYRVESVIGSGGLSTVHRAHDQALGRDVPIKWLPPGPVEPAHQDTELAILAGLDHHNLITVLDAGMHTDASGREVRYI